MYRCPVCGTFADAPILIGDGATFGISRLSWLKWAMVAFDLTPALDAQHRHGTHSDERGFIAGGAAGLRARVWILRWTGKLPNPKRRNRSAAETYQNKPLKKEVCLLPIQLVTHLHARLCQGMGSDARRRD